MCVMGSHVSCRLQEKLTNEGFRSQLIDQSETPGAAKRPVLSEGYHSGRTGVVFASQALVMTSLCSCHWRSPAHSPFPFLTSSGH